MTDDENDRASLLSLARIAGGVGGIVLGDYCPAISGSGKQLNEKSGLIHAKRAAIRLHHRSGDPFGDRLRIVSAFELCQGARKVI